MFINSCRKRWPCSFSAWRIHSIIIQKTVQLPNGHWCMRQTDIYGVSPCTGAPNRKFWGKDHFKHFGRLLGKNLSAPHSQQVWWKSFQPARCTCNLQSELLGSLSADVCSDITGQFGCGHRAKFRLSVGGFRRKMGVAWGRNSPLWWRGRSKGGFLQRTHTSYSRHQLPHTPWIVFCPATLSFQGHLPASKNLPEEQIFWGTQPLGAPACHTVRPNTSFKVTLRESRSFWSLHWRNKRTKQAMRQ